MLSLRFRNKSSVAHYFRPAAKSPALCAFAACDIVADPASLCLPVPVHSAGDAGSGGAATVIVLPWLKILAALLETHPTGKGVMLGRVVPTRSLS